MIGGAAMLVLPVVLTLSMAVPAPPPAVSGSVAAADRAVTFTVDGTVTYGTLHVPTHRRGDRLPAALLLPGSGPTDRNGNQLPAFTPYTLAQLAAGLGRDGIMTLRFDKYGAGQTGMGAYWSRPLALDYPAIVRQAVAAYETLRDQWETDPAALYVAGHSEGGLTAMHVARRARPRPAGIALLAPQSLRILDHIRQQLNLNLVLAARSGRITQVRRMQVYAALGNAIADWRARRPVDPRRLPPEIGSTFEMLRGINQRYTESQDAISPAAVARGLPAGLPVLLACGTNDAQVTCADTTVLADVLRGRTSGPGRMVLPGLDHFFSTPRRPFVVTTSTLAALRSVIHGPSGSAASCAGDAAADMCGARAGRGPDGMHRR
jgi:alpha-beta hydrolase superfamily lysophospholipase